MENKASSGIAEKSETESFLEGLDTLVSAVGINSFTIPDIIGGIFATSVIVGPLVTSDQFVQFITHGEVQTLADFTQFMPPLLEHGLLFLQQILGQ